MLRGPPRALRPLEHGLPSSHHKSTPVKARATGDRRGPPTHRGSHRDGDRSPGEIDAFGAVPDRRAERRGSRLPASVRPVCTSYTNKVLYVHGHRHGALGPSARRRVATSATVRKTTDSGAP